MKLHIVFATGNANKVREIREILSTLQQEDPAFAGSELTIESMKEAGVAADPEENGTTFEENALIKARAVAQLIEASGNTALKERSVPVIVMSDDSGLCVDAMKGAPGILSARFLGHDTDYTVKMNAILEKLEDVADEKRGAQFVAAVAAIAPKIPANSNLSDHSLLDGCTVRGVMEGRIGREILGAHGFGYDPFFYLPDLHKTSAELTDDEKNAISHRGKAIRKMMQFLAQKL